MPNSYWILGASLTILQILGIIITVAGFVKIIANDLKHLTLDVKEIKKSQEKEEERIAKLEVGFARVDERTKNQRFNRKIKAIKKNR
jgi:hypothetical protein